MPPLNTTLNTTLIHSQLRPWPDEDQQEWTIKMDRDISTAILLVFIRRLCRLCIIISSTVAVGYWGNTMLTPEKCLPPPHNNRRYFKSLRSRLIDVVFQVEGERLALKLFSGSLVRERRSDSETVECLETTACFGTAPKQLTCWGSYSKASGLPRQRPPAQGGP